MGVVEKTFIVWCPELGEESAEDGRKVKGWDDENAAQNWARYQDYRSGDYWIVGGDGTDVFVQDENGVVTQYHVYGEQNINYYTRQANKTPEPLHVSAMGKENEGK